MRGFNIYIVLFIVICHQYLFVYSQMSDLRETREPIKLSGIVNVREYVSFECEKMCGDVYTVQSPVSVTNREVKLRTNMSTVNCQEGEWILKWDFDDLGEQFGNANCSSRTYLSSCKYECAPCICVSPQLHAPNFNKTVVKSFSLHPQESESQDNRIVTGIRFGLDRSNNIIQLIIQQGRLLSNGSVEQEKTWKQMIDFKQLVKDVTGSDDLTRLEFGKDYISFSYDTRTIFLDDIFVPEDYVVTGVRFVKIDQSELHKGVKLQVKGTKYDSSFRLRTDSARWFDYSDRINQHFSYNWARREIRLDNCTDPTLVNNNTIISDTNRFVQFRATDMRKDSEKRVIPYIGNEPVETRFDLPLRGVGLSYIGQEGYGGFVIPKVFYHTSLIYTSEGILKAQTDSAVQIGGQLIVFTLLPLLSFLQ